MFIFSILQLLFSWINRGRRDLKTTTPGDFGHRLIIIIIIIIIIILIIIIFIS